MEQKEQEAKIKEMLKAHIPELDEQDAEGLAYQIHQLYEPTNKHNTEVIHDETTITTKIPEAQVQNRTTG